MKNNFPNSFAHIKLKLLSKNIQEIKRRSGKQKILAVVKCDAYRHGAKQVSRHVQDEADWFAVATVDEAIELRMNGIKKPILVFGVPTYDNAAAYQTHGLTATISHQTHFSTLMDGTSYHLNFDTGMGRLGFRPEQVEEVRKLAIANQRLVCSGIYSHYATADDPGSDFVHTQNKRFKHVLARFSEIPLVHMSNTGAVANYNNTDIDHFGMIRSGIGMLGYNSGSTRYSWLHPVLQWKARISQIRFIKKGDVVSYSSSWQCPQDGYIVTIPTGYGDGVPRSLSNKLKVMIGGEFYPQVGNVTMDYLMVYTGKTKLNPASEVILLGKEGLNAQDWAEKGGTNAHEILTNITSRVEKVYE